MIILKLRHRPSDRTTIVECAKVDVSADRDGGYVATVTSPEGTVSEFRVHAHGEYDIAYVENSAGSTTQVIKPRMGP